MVKPAHVIGPNTQSGYNSSGDYGEFAVPDLACPELGMRVNHPSPARLVLWFKDWNEAVEFSKQLAAFD